MPRKVTCDNPRLRLPSSRFAHIGTPRWQCSYFFPFNLDLAHAQPKTGDLNPFFRSEHFSCVDLFFSDIPNHEPEHVGFFFDVFHMFTVLYSWDTAPPSGPVIESSHASSLCRVRTEWLRLLWGSLSKNAGLWDVSGNIVGIELPRVYFSCSMANLPATGSCEYRWDTMGDFTGYFYEL